MRSQTSHAGKSPFLGLTVIVTLGLAGMVAYLTLTPVTVPSFAPSSDKLYHFLAFAMLCFPCALMSPRALPWVFPAVVFFGAMIEVIQPSVGRSAEFADFLADLTGAVAGTLAGLGIRLVIKALLKSANTQTTPPETSEPSPSP